jgi:hypothetical protein
MLEPVHVHAMSRQYISGAWRAGEWCTRTEPLRKRRADINRRIDAALAAAATTSVATGSSLVAALSAWEVNEDHYDDLYEEPDESGSPVDLLEQFSDAGGADSDPEASGVSAEALYEAMCDSGQIRFGSPD